MHHFWSIDRLANLSLFVKWQPRIRLHYNSYSHTYSIQPKLYLPNEWHGQRKRNKNEGNFGNLWLIAFSLLAFLPDHTRRVSDHNHSSHRFDDFSLWGRLTWHRRPSEVIPCDLFTRPKLPQHGSGPPKFLLKFQICVHGGPPVHLFAHRHCYDGNAKGLHLSYRDRLLKQLGPVSLLATTFPLRSRFTGNLLT